MGKRVLDVTTKDWSDREIASFRDKVNLLNYKWEGKCINEDGIIKWFHAHTKVDIELFALQEGYKILKVSRKNK